MRTSVQTRRFDSAEEEAAYLYQKLLYWLYDRAAPSRARPFADRLARLIPRSPTGSRSIFHQECLALIEETRGRIDRAIRRRQEEIRLIERLHTIVKGTPAEKTALSHYPAKALRDRLELLAILHHESENLPAAIETLLKAKVFCQGQRIPFKSQRLLAGYRAEMASSNGKASGVSA